MNLTKQSVIWPLWLVCLQAWLFLAEAPNGFLLMGAGAATALADEAGGSNIAPRDRYLLLDTRLIASTDNAVLKLGTVTKHRANPLLSEELPWETEMSHMYASVIFDREEGIYKCWYYSHIKDWGKDVEPGPLAAKEQNGARQLRHTLCHLEGWH